LIAHERSKTITRSAEMKEIRERMQVRNQKGACIRQQSYYCLLHSIDALVALA